MTGYWIKKHRGLATAFVLTVIILGSTVLGTGLWYAGQFGYEAYQVRQENTRLWAERSRLLKKRNELMQQRMKLNDMKIKRMEKDLGLADPEEL